MGALIADRGAEQERTGKKHGESHPENRESKKKNLPLLPNVASHTVPLPFRAPSRFPSLSMSLPFPRTL